MSLKVNMKPKIGRIVIVTKKNRLHRYAAFSYLKLNRETKLIEFCYEAYILKCLPCKK